MAIEVGQEAPDFTLKGPGGDEVTLSSFRGKKNVVLVFFPLAFSGICTTQLSGIAAHSSEYADADAQVLGVSVDSHHANTAFAKSLGLTDAMLLADFQPRGATAQAYGVYMDGPGISKRASFVIDKQGIVRHAEIQDPPTIPDEEAYFAALATCNV